MKSLLLLALCVMGVGLLSGCGSKEDIDPNYTTQIKKTDAGIAREKTVMQDQKAPGAVTPGQPIGVMKKPGGKK